MAVILPSTYTDGTATCTNGSPNVVGTGTMWVNTVLPGDFIWFPSGETVRVLTVVDDTHITLAYNWPGVSQSVTGPYEIRFQSDQARVQETTRQLLQRMQSGNLYAFAGLSGDTDLIPIFTSPGAMSLISKQDLINGVNYDVQVNTLADRAPYDTQVTGFTVLVSNVGDGRSAVYSKNSNASGDWSAPAYVTGPTGAQGDPGPVGLVSRGTYSGATAYVPTDWVLYNGSSWECIAATTGNAPPNLPTTSNTYWTLIAAKGTDGTGTGDVVGPSGAVDKNIAIFNTATGKLIADSGISINLLSPENATAITNLNSPTKTGLYKFGASATNAPFTQVGLVLTVFYSSTQGRQVAYRIDDAARWERYFNTTWSTWVQTNAATGVTFDNTTASLPGSPATVQAAINALATNTAAGKNDALFAIEIADLKGQRMGMVGGVADSFDDTTGVLSVAGGIDNNVTTMLHFDGANNSTTMTDSSFYAKAWTAVGDAKISTAQSKFGGASLLLDGTGDHVTRAYDSDLDMYGDFTIDGWFRTTVDSKMLYMKGGGTGGIMISVGATTLATGVTANRVGVWLSGGTTVTGTSVVTDGNWHHVAITRSGSTVRVFVDGALEGTGTHSVALTANIAAFVGSDGTGNYFNGNIDELRISKGVARWTAAFTVATAAYATPPYIYDAANDWFTPSMTFTVQDIGAPSSTIAYSASTRVDRSVFLTPADVITAIGVHLVTAASIKMKILKRNSAGNYDVVVDQAFSHPGGGFATVTLTTPFTVPGTGDYCVGIFLPASTNTNRTAAANYAYVATTDVTGTGVSFTEISDAQIPPFRILKNATSLNMTLQSVVYNVSSTPSTARFALQLADNLTLTPGTDFSVEVSRDGGTTWTAVTMALTMSYFGGVKMYEGTATISAQPTGTAMVWRFKTLTNKAVIASGVVLQQS